MSNVPGMISANTRVTVHSLGDGHEYSGIIKGISEFRSESGMPGRYIVECSYAQEHFGYPCFSVPEGCVRS